MTKRTHPQTHPTHCVNFRPRRLSARALLRRADGYRPHTIAMSRNFKALGHVLATMDETSDKGATRDISVAADQFRKNDFDASAIRKWVLENVTTRDTRRLSQAVASANDDVLRGFRKYFRAGVESTLRGEY